MIVSSPRSPRGRGGDSPSEKPTCVKYGKKQMGECIVGTDYSFGCGKSSHKVTDCPLVRGQGKGSNQAQACGPSSDAPKKKRFYAL